MEHHKLYQSNNQQVHVVKQIQSYTILYFDGVNTEFDKTHIFTLKELCYIRFGHKLKTGLDDDFFVNVDGSNFGYFYVVNWSKLCIKLISYIITFWIVAATTLQKWLVTLIQFNS